MDGPLGIASTYEAFTPLDTAVARAIAAGRAGVEGALDHGELSRLVDEFSRLNLQRPRTSFHVGYFDALWERPIDPARVPHTAIHRAWYVTGALQGFAQEARTKDLVEGCEAHAEELELLGSGRHEASDDVLPLLVTAFLRSERADLIARWIDPLVLARTRRSRPLEELLEKASECLRRYRKEEASPLLSLLERAVAIRVARGLEPFEDSFVARLERRLAHRDRLYGDSESARMRLEGLLERPEVTPVAMVLADLGLIACEVKALGDVGLPADRSRFGDVVALLEPGESYFRASAEQGPSSGGHGEYCLGVLLLARGQHAQALPFLEQAVAEMALQGKRYEDLRVLPRARLYLASCVANEFDQARASRIEEWLLDSVRVHASESPSLVAETLSGLAQLDPAQAARVAEKLSEVGSPELLEAVLEAGLLPRLASFREQLLARSRSPRRSRAERFEDGRTLVHACLRSDDLERAREALDVLQELAEREPERSRFVAWLDDPGHVDPAWDPDEVDWVKVHLHESAGEIEAAASLLEELGHRALSRNGAASLTEVLDVLDRLRALAVPPSEHLLGRVRALEESDARAEAEEAPRKVHGTILFVGGLEPQVGIEEWVLAQVRERWPEVEVEFRNTLMNSNYGRQFDAMVPALERARAVVIHRLVRTNMGRLLRRYCNDHDLAWVACGGRGRESFLRAVEQAIAVLARRSEPAS